MGTPWSPRKRWVVGLLLAPFYVGPVVLGLLSLPFTLASNSDARVDRHYHARVALEQEVSALEQEVGALEQEVGIIRDLVRRQDKYIDCYYETAHRQYKRMEALSTCLKLK